LEPGLAYVHVGPCRRAELAHAAQGFPTLGRQRANEICAQHVAKGMAGRRIACQRLPASASTSIRIRGTQHTGPLSNTGGSPRRPVLCSQRHGHWSTRGADRQAASSAIDFLCLSAVDASRSLANSLEARSSELRVGRLWLVTRGSWLVAHDGNATGERGVRGPACDHSSQRSLRAFPLQHGRQATGLTAAAGSDNTWIPACLSSYLPSGQPARRSPLAAAAAVVVRSRRYRLLRAQSVSDKHESWKVA
jgi:hypothetical protein